jgi:predicted RNase H-like HicB family nuclease
MRRYVALLHPDATGGYGISLPDFPGCISAGDSMAEAADQGALALRLHVEGMMEDDLAIPEPRSAEALKKLMPDWFEGATIVLVPLLPPRIGAERLNISLDRNLVREIDAAAKALGMNRSAFLAEGARRLLEAMAISGGAHSPDGMSPAKGVAAKDNRRYRPKPTEARRRGTRARARP